MAMSSYLSSFTSSSAISNLGTRLTHLRRAITLGDEGDDPDNEDCSHISNALRAYYTEKGRPFPPWLPPDPKAPVPAAPPARVVATTQLPQPGVHGQQPAAAHSRGGGLGDLWGDSGASQPPPLTSTASLRRPRVQVQGPPGLNTPPPPPSPSRSAPPGPVASPSPPPGSLHPSGARPLPSQRSGSYQSSQTARLDRTQSSAQDRLRARLHGGGGRSPSPNTDPSVRRPVGMSGRPR